MAEDGGIAVRIASEGAYNPTIVASARDMTDGRKGIRLLKRVNAERQVEMVELMLSINNFTPAYAKVLILATPKHQLRNAHKPRIKQGVSAEGIAQTEQEMESLEHDAKAVEADYGADVLTLTLARGYIKKLLENAKIVRFLNRNYREILTEFEGIAATEFL